MRLGDGGLAARGRMAGAQCRQDPAGCGGRASRARWRRRLYARAAELDAVLPQPRPGQLLAECHLLDRRSADAGDFRHPASRHSRHGQCAEIYRPAGYHSHAHRGHRPDPHGADHLVQLHAAGAPCGGLCAGPWGLEHRRLDAGSGRSLHRRLVHLRLRDRHLLHQRVPRSEDGHLQGHLLFRLLCLLLYTLVPFTFQGVLGVEGMLDPTIVDGSGVAAAMAGWWAAGPSSRTSSSC